MQSIELWMDIYTVWPLRHHLYVSVVEKKRAEPKRKNRRKQESHFRRKTTHEQRGKLIQPIIENQTALSSTHKSENNKAPEALCLKKLHGF